MAGLLYDPDILFHAILSVHARRAKRAKPNSFRRVGIGCPAPADLRAGQRNTGRSTSNVWLLRQRLGVLYPRGCVLVSLSGRTRPRFPQPGCPPQADPTPTAFLPAP